MVNKRKVLPNKNRLSRSFSLNRILKNCCLHIGIQHYNLEIVRHKLSFQFLPRDFFILRSKILFFIDIFATMSLMV